MDYTQKLKDYIEEERKVIDSLNIEEINVVMNVLEETRKKHGRIYICGNGGSGATASHFVCDFNKGVGIYCKDKYQFICLNDNIPSMLAISNDISYDDVFSFQIDGVITEAKILKDLAEDVGENWVVAADDVANFAKSFPEVIEAQESYNFLQDGSLQLTKEGQELFQETINQRKADLIAQNEAYQLQMQKQAAIAKATAEYYTKQADLLEANLKGEIDSTAAKALMEQNLADYKSELMEATGLDDEELTNLINENMALTQTEAADKIGEIYNYWCAVGEAAQNASVAYANGEFEDPGKSNEFSGGTVKVTANKFTPSKRPDDFVFEKDQQMALIEQYRKLANES